MMIAYEINHSQRFVVRRPFDLYAPRQIQKSTEQYLLHINFKQIDLWKFRGVLCMTQFGLH